MWNKTLLLLSFLTIGLSGFSQDIFDAARTGNLEQIKMLSAKNRDTVNAVNERGFNPLMIACYRGQTEAAMLLVKKGADVNAKSAEGSALQAACYQNNTELTAFLIKKKANIEVKGPDGNNALMYAVMNQNVEIVKLLVKKGADLQAKNNDGQTAYSLAMTLENKEIQELVK